MKLRYLKQLPLLMASWALYAAADKKIEMQPEDCVELCYAGPQLTCDDYWDLSAAAIYFQARAQGGDVALLTQDRDNLNYPVNGVGIQPNEDISWGFKVGLGYKLFREDWKVAGRYTYFNSVTNTPLVSGYGGGFIPSAYSNQFIGANNNTSFDIFANMETGIRNTINNVNVIAMRPSFIDRKIQVATYYGIDMTFLTRRTFTSFTNDISGDARYISAFGGFFQNYQKYNWWGVGPMVGTQAKYYLNYDISLYADVYGAVNYGSSSCRFATSSNPGYPSPPSTGNLLPQEAVIMNQTYQFAPELSYQLGVNWTKITEDNTLLFGINIGYEATYFFNLIKTITPTDAYRVEDGAGIGLQGLVLEGYLDF